MADLQAMEASLGRNQVERQEWELLLGWVCYL